MNNKELLPLLKESMSKEPKLQYKKLQDQQKKDYKKIEEEEMNAYLHGQKIEHYESDQTKMLKWPEDEFPKAEDKDARIETQKEIKLNPENNTKVG